ncbi:DUF3969 family protein [Hyalangium gracile]|uniref:DUF3969 family protein n=1 Tax=Hyalangium gracile TaxID=394092 RepID=UPI001CCC5EC4|nr:DUF3969 family protein [Hyalangium gracile]
MKRSSRAVKLELRAQGKEEVEKLLATIALGLAEAVEAGKMTPSDACDHFFVPVFLRFASPSGKAHGGVDRRLVEALHAGSELEDVEQLAPHGLKSAFRDIRENALNVLGELAPSEAQLGSSWLRSSPRRGAVSGRGRTPRAASGAARGGRRRR